MGLNANNVITVQRVGHNVSTIEKPRHTEIFIMKAATGSDGKDGKDGYNGRDGRDGRDGHDGINGLNGKDGGIFVPIVDNGKISWNYTQEIDLTELPTTNILANISSITNAEIYNIINNGDS